LVAQHPCRDIEEFKAEIDPYTHIRGENDTDLTSRPGDGTAASLIETRGAEHQRTARAQADI
jgi:hypothetical protein